MSGPAPASLPDGALITWYGDDFTGAAAVMEVMTFSGLPAVLFLDVPDKELLQRFDGYRGIGIAGAARSQTPDWMESNLPPVFAAMAQTAAPVAHYKICSTLDSAPTVGSIGRAVELAEPALGGAWHPLVVAAPQIGRYQVFGNLFARAGQGTYRLDRHPTMRNHPVTPMHEADVGLHLAQQTEIPIGLIDINTLHAGNAQSALDRECADGRILIAIDILDERSLIEAGRLIWENRGKRILAIGSQGIEYALIAYWEDCGLVSEILSAGHRKPADRIIVVSGSCSPVTAEQISWALQNGFAGRPVNPSLAVDERAWEGEIESATKDALSMIDAGSDPILYTALGPADPTTEAFRQAVSSSGKPAEQVNAAVGSGLGRLMRQVMNKTGVKRGVVAGGDTSSHATRELGICALTALALISPGASICTAHPDDPSSEAFEIALKGGQMGERDYFGQVKHGGKLQV